MPVTAVTRLVRFTPGAALVVTVAVFLAFIVRDAFGLEAAGGGIAGAMLNGVKRGLFSNEAGMGSAPNIAAVATPDPHHPSSQGFVQALGVFIDTILVCTATALLILLSGVMVPGSELTGTPLTQTAMTEHIGHLGDDFIAIAIFFFAFTSRATSASLKASLTTLPKPPPELSAGPVAPASRSASGINIVLPQYPHRTVTDLMASASSGAAHVEQLKGFGMYSPHLQKEFKQVGL